MHKRDWWILAGVSTVWIVGAVGYWRLSRDLNTLFLSTNAFAVLVAAYVSVLTAWRTSEVRQTQLRFDRIENAFAFIDKWDSPLYSEARDKIREISKNPGRHAQEDIRTAIHEDHSLEKSVIAILNFFGEIDMSLRFKRADEELLFETFWEPYAIVYPMLQAYRENDLQNQYGNWMVSLNELYQRWHSRRDTHRRELSYAQSDRLR